MRTAVICFCIEVVLTTPPAAAAKICMCQVLMHELFVVANHLVANHLVSYGVFQKLYNAHYVPVQWRCSGEVITDCA